MDEKGIAIIPIPLRQTWPNGIVPFELDPLYNSTELKQIYSGLKYLEDVTRINGRDCVKFVPHTVESHWVSVFPGDGCYSGVGRNLKPGSQVLSLARPGCLNNAVVAHEFLHALGFFHEQSRPDRDDYVTINFDNIEVQYWPNFAKYGEDQVQTLGEPYDYDSVMHYNTKDFSKNGEPTVVPIQQGAIIGQRRHLSEIDIKEVRKLYNCF